MSERGSKNQESPRQEAKEYSEIRDIIIIRCIETCFRSLLSASGTGEAIQAMRPHCMHSGMAAACNARQRFNLQGDGLDQVVIPLLWLDTAMSNGDISLKIFARGTVMEVRDCPLKTAPPEFCVPVSSYMAEGMCQTINPDYEYLYTHRLTNGDPYCRAIIKRKSDRSELNDLGKLLRTVPKLDMPDEEVDNLRAHCGAVILMNTTRAFIDLHGSGRTLEISGPAQFQAGLSIGEWLIHKLRLCKGDLSDIGMVIYTIGLALGQERETTSLPTGAIAGKVIGCPFEGAPPEVCVQLEMLTSGIVSAIDPSYEFIYDRMMTRGEKTCHWAIRKKAKPSESKEGPAEVQLAVSALDILKERFARGEISKEEYREQRDILLER
jgi:hypothetical protein